jgi:hypothetical protein
MSSILWSYRSQFISVNNVRRQQPLSNAHVKTVKPVKTSNQQSLLFPERMQHSPSLCKSLFHPPPGQQLPS